MAGRRSKVLTSGRCEWEAANHEQLSQLRAKIRRIPPSPSRTVFLLQSRDTELAWKQKQHSQIHYSAVSVCSSKVRLASNFLLNLDYQNTLELSSFCLQSFMSLGGQYSSGCLQRRHWIFKFALLNLENFSLVKGRV